MNDRSKRLACKRRLRAHLLGVIAEMEQLRRDIEWWNANRTDAAPFDAGGDIATAALARQVLERLEANEPIPDSLWERYRQQLEGNAR
jgi:hypothetical protein